MGKRESLRTSESRATFPTRGSPLLSLKARMCEVKEGGWRAVTLADMLKCVSLIRVWVAMHDVLHLRFFLGMDGPTPTHHVLRYYSLFTYLCINID